MSRRRRPAGMAGEHVRLREGLIPATQGQDRRRMNNSLPGTRLI